MNIDVKLFAGARQRVGQERITVSLSEAACVADLRTAMAEDFPQLAGLLPRAMFAVDTAYVTDATPLENVREIVCIPPVSGG